MPGRDLLPPLPLFTVRGKPNREAYEIENEDPPENDRLKERREEWCHVLTLAYSMWFRYFIFTMTPGIAAEYAPAR